MKIKILLNIDCKPNFTRIPKDTIVEVVHKMNNGYVMVSYQGGCYPVPPGSYEVVECL